MAMSKFSKSAAALPPVRENLPSPPPTIPFVSKVKMMGKVYGPDTCRQVWVDQVGVSHGSRQPNIRLQVLPIVFIFKDGCPEDWIKWVMAFYEIENLMPMKEPANKTR
jgi:hypothetical protein